MKTRKPQADRPPPWLWPVGIAALGIGAVAFVLWGTQGAGYVFDLLVAYCF